MITYITCLDYTTQLDMEKNKKYSSTIEDKIVNRLTSLWGFSESAFGGLLHLMKIPFRGMALASSSVTLLSMIAYYSGEKKKILKATMLVILVKFIISPYTPFTAYLAVTFQGITGYIIYGTKRMFKLSTLFHAILAQIQSSLQKFIGLTIFFGMTFWHSLDLYIEYIAEKFGLLSNEGNDVSYSFLFVAFYVFIHVIAGVITGVIAGKLPGKIEQRFSEKGEFFPQSSVIISDNNHSNNKRKRKFWWQRRSGIVLIITFAVMALFPYFDPSLEESITGNVIYMIVRAIVITFVWFVLISPLLVKYLKKYLRKKESVYIDELNEILDIVPVMKTLARQKWNERKKEGLKKIPVFIFDLFSSLLFLSLEQEDDILVDKYEKKEV